MNKESRQHSLLLSQRLSSARLLQIRRYGAGPSSKLLGAAAGTCRRSAQITGCKRGLQGTPVGMSRQSAWDHYTVRTALSPAVAVGPVVVPPVPMWVPVVPVPVVPVVPVPVVPAKQISYNSHCTIFFCLHCKIHLGMSTPCTALQALHPACPTARCRSAHSQAQSQGPERRRPGRPSGLHLLPYLCGRRCRPPCRPRGRQCQLSRQCLRRAYWWSCTGWTCAGIQH